MGYATKTDYIRRLFSIAPTLANKPNTHDDKNLEQTTLPPYGLNYD